MSGLGVRVYTDEMINAGLAAALRSHSYDAESCQEAGRSGQGIPDEEQLAYAAQHGRAILTYNASDFYHRDHASKSAAPDHAGIIVSPEIDDLGELLRRVERHLNTYPPAVQNNLVLWLG